MFNKTLNQYDNFSTEETSLSEISKQVNRDLLDHRFKQIEGLLQQGRSFDLSHFQDPRLARSFLDLVSQPRISKDLSNIEMDNQITDPLNPIDERDQEALDENNTGSNDPFEEYMCSSCQLATEDCTCYRGEEIILEQCPPTSQLSVDAQVFYPGNPVKEGDDNPLLGEGSLSLEQTEPETPKPIDVVVLETQQADKEKCDGNTENKKNLSQESMSNQKQKIPPSNPLPISDIIGKNIKGQRKGEKTKVWTQSLFKKRSGKQVVSHENIKEYAPTQLSHEETEKGAEFSFPFPTYEKKTERPHEKYQWKNPKVYPTQTKKSETVTPNFYHDRELTQKEIYEIVIYLQQRGVMPTGRQGDIVSDKSLHPQLYVLYNYYLALEEYEVHRLRDNTRFSQDQFEGVLKKYGINPYRLMVSAIESNLNSLMKMSQMSQDINILERTISSIPTLISNALKGELNTVTAKLDSLLSNKEVLSFAKEQSTQKHISHKASMKPELKKQPILSDSPLSRSAFHQSETMKGNKTYYDEHNLWAEILKIPSLSVDVGEEEKKKEYPKKMILPSPSPREIPKKKINEAMWAWKIRCKAAGFSDDQISMCDQMKHIQSSNIQGKQSSGLAHIVAQSVKLPPSTDSLSGASSKMGLSKLEKIFDIYREDKTSNKHVTRRYINAYIEEERVPQHYIDKMKGTDISGVLSILDSYEHDRSNLLDLNIEKEDSEEGSSSPDQHKKVQYSEYFGGETIYSSKKNKGG